MHSPFAVRRVNARRHANQVRSLRRCCYEHDSSSNKSPIFPEMLVVKIKKYYCIICVAYIFNAPFSINSRGFCCLRNAIIMQHEERLVNPFVQFEREIFSQKYIHFHLYFFPNLTNISVPILSFFLLKFNYYTISNAHS